MTRHATMDAKARFREPTGGPEEPSTTELRSLTVFSVRQTGRYVERGRSVEARVKEGSYATPPDAMDDAIDGATGGAIGSASPPS